MLYPKELFIILWLLGSSMLYAQVSFNDPHKQALPDADLNYETCLNTENGQSTAGMIACAREAETAWDKELNRYYQLLMNVLKAAEKEKLRQSQRNWLMYRDSEFEFSGLFHNNMEGSMYLIFAADKRVEVVRQRTLELKYYYEDMLEYGHHRE